MNCSASTLAVEELSLLFGEGAYYVGAGRTPPQPRSLSLLFVSVDVSTSG